jgi:hypothetical protein
MAESRALPSSIWKKCQRLGRHREGGPGGGTLASNGSWCLTKCLPTCWRYQSIRADPSSTPPEGLLPSSESKKAISAITAGRQVFLHVLFSWAWSPVSWPSVSAASGRLKCSVAECQARSRLILRATPSSGSGLLPRKLDVVPGGEEGPPSSGVAEGVGGTCGAAEGNTAWNKRFLAAAIALCSRHPRLLTAGRGAAAGARHPSEPSSIFEKRDGRQREASRKNADVLLAAVQNNKISASSSPFGSPT